MWCARYSILWIGLAASLVMAPASRGQATDPLADTIDAVPAGWTGPVFHLSKNYPTTLPTEPKPWKAFDFKTQQREYLQAVLAYALEGNDAAQWKVQDNAVRKWYHAPALLGGAKAGDPAVGREFIRGLTRERNSRPAELHPNQDKAVSNWAVGFFNPIAAYTIGKVWANPAAPDTNAVKFEDGAVAFKLLFTSASATEVPFLSDSMKWQANIDLAGLSPPSITRQPQDVSLLQVDLAVRDNRADTTTGWVFGTFMYQNDAPGASALERLVPVGLMWGNDPGLTKIKYDMGERPTESWLNKAGTPATKSPHFGWLDRLNGPVDNPSSSCLSCHARAVVPYVAGNTAPSAGSDPDDPTKKFFTNTMAGEVYEGAPTGSRSLDYSLQLAVGVRLFPGSGPLHSLEKGPVDSFDFRGGGESDEATWPTATPKDASPATSPAQSGGGETNWWPWVGIVAAIFVLLITIIWGIRRRQSAKS